MSCLQANLNTVFFINSFANEAVRISLLFAKLLLINCYAVSLFASKLLLNTSLKYSIKVLYG